MKVRREITIEAGPEIAWEWMNDLERLATVNMFHGQARFLDTGRQGTGTRLGLRHGLKIGGWMPFGMERVAKITRWEEGKAIGWVELDPGHPKALFPHSQLFTLEAENGRTRLVNELRGSLNLPLGRWSEPLDRLFGRYWVGRVLERENRQLKRRIEQGQI